MMLGRLSSFEHSGFFRHSSFELRHSFRFPIVRLSFNLAGAMKFDQLHALYHQPLFDLISQSRAVHLKFWQGEEVQRCSLLSIKTGGCSEDCAYCAQSSHYSTGIEREDLLSTEEILCAAKQARAHGATRFCMGAAWRGV